MPVRVQGPDGAVYSFPDGTDKTAAIAYFKKKNIGAAPATATTEKPETGWEHYAHSAGIPAHVAEVTPMLRGMVSPEESREHPGFGQTIPIFGPAFRAQ